MKMKFAPDRDRLIVNKATEAAINSEIEKLQKERDRIYDETPLAVEDSVVAKMCQPIDARIITLIESKYQKKKAG